mmetsp:Transcript_69927/g.167853  ORF Transcript_69927/g.167853 Transcript_69927/m.167853 type:complete len:848 (-) Transcript_69927:83-2626(-)
METVPHPTAFVTAPHAARLLAAGGGSQHQSTRPCGHGGSAPKSTKGAGGYPLACLLGGGASAALASKNRRKSGRAGHARKAGRSVARQAAAAEVKNLWARQAAYGSWTSPITPESITTTGVGLSSLKCGPDGDLFWLEARPEEAGRQVVCKLATAADKGREASNPISPRGGVDVSPKKENVRTRVHEYGGASYLLGPDGDGIIFSSFKDQRLYWKKKNGTIVNLTPKPFFAEDAQFRFADAVLDKSRNRLICIREDHTNPAPSEVKNTLCAVPLDGSGIIEVLAEGYDFYVSPRLSPDDSKLAWICWDHPNMPWDTTELWYADVNPQNGKLQGLTQVTPKAQSSMMQPAWSPDGVLHFMSDSSGYWNFYSCSADGKKVQNLFPRQADLNGGLPPAGWRLGMQNFDFLPDGRIVTTYQPESAADGMAVVILDPSEPSKDNIVSKVVGAIGGEGTGVASTEFKDGLPKSISEFCFSKDGKTMYLLGGGPSTPSGIYKWTVPEAGKSSSEQPELLVSSVLKEKQIEPAYVSAAVRMKFPTTNGKTAFANYYAPLNPDFVAPEGTKPPLIVKAHGGPTACASTVVNPGIQFWTSRGFAVLDVDYRGSTGLGRKYRNRLKGQWGVVDVDDVCAGAKYLVKEGLVDPEMLAIDGVSAGGFTTLAALTFKDVFTAGCSLYGIGDLETLAGDTHKFESRYLDGLIGPWPEAKDTYKARSPVNHVDQLSCPILLLQGAEDKVVPPNQAEAMFKAVKARGLPCALKMYPQEQHGFRRSENIQDALKSELSFYGSVFGFTPSAEARTDLEIANIEAVVVRKPTVQQQAAPARDRVASKKVEKPDEGKSRKMQKFLLRH